jgi:hypothetical protein
MGVERPLLLMSERSLAGCGRTEGSTALRLLFEHGRSDHGVLVVVIVATL